MRAPHWGPSAVFLSNDFLPTYDTRRTARLVRADNHPHLPAALMARLSCLNGIVSAPSSAAMSVRICKTSSGMLRTP